MYNSKVTSKLYDYFRFTVGMKPANKGWLSGDCPSCGSVKKFGINIALNRSNCFKCGEDRKPIWIMAELQDLKTRNEINKYLDSMEDSNYGIFQKTESEYEFKTPEYKGKLPPEYKLIGVDNSYMEKVVQKNLKSRGFKISTLMLEGVGYCVTGKYAGRIILPYYYSGKLVYFTARAFINKGTKFSNPTEEEIGIGKSMLIYNRDALYIYDKIWLFESITNCLTMGSNAIGLGGKSLSPWQRSEIIRSPAKKLIIGLDEDAYPLGLKMGYDLSQYKQIKVVKFPKDLDANDLGKKETKLLEKATPFKTSQELYKEYLNHQKV